MRRLLTRTTAIIPAVLVILWQGDKGSYRLLILSQVILSVQLPFAVVPLVQFTCSRKRMGEFVNPLWVKLLAWIVTAIIVGLNLWLLAQTVGDWLGGK